MPSGKRGELDMIRDIIKDKLREKEWTFGEIANVSETVIELADYAYATMTAKEKLDLIWDDKTSIDSPTFGAIFQYGCNLELKKQIAVLIKEELSDATVVFKEDNKNEVSERSVGGESHKERSTDEEGHNI